MKKIYIFFSKTGTLPSKLIHLSLGGRYTHVSLAITPETSKLYSFARRTLHNPFNAGFMIEDTSTHVFAQYPDCDCAVYSLEVSDESYDKIKTILKRFLQNEKRYTYNFLGALPARLGYKFERKYKFTCSQFVAYVLHTSGAVELSKNYSLMMPNDFLELPNINLVYSGKIGKCRIESDTVVETAN